MGGIKNCSHMHEQHVCDSPVRPHTFPDELVEEILICAWVYSTWSSPKSRWLLYQKTLRICRQWNAIIRSVVDKYRFLESLADFQLYSHLDYLRSKHCDTLSLPFKYLRIPYNDMAISYSDGFQLGSYLNRCSELEISPMYDGKLWALCRLLSFAAKPHLRSLSVAFENWAAYPFSDKTAWEETVSRAVVTLPSVTSLSITCTNTKNTQWIYRNILDFKSALIPFPNLTHLRTNVPVTIGLVTEYLQKLVILTLDIPPLYFKNLRGTSLLNWGLVTALRNRAFQPKKVVIESGPLKPSGWDRLAETCQVMNVELVHEVKYAETYQQPSRIDGVTESARYLEAASLRFKELPVGDSAAVTECVDRYISRYHTEACTTDTHSSEAPLIFVMVRC
ncbi:hypothetical protein BXZ70DRAFT_457401 [Cristinia sonorae]|uniref:Uncharacterized protein n=1 Tax=Cristinia sonorae TaxID=1940300 RepID=A0A8K0XM27_9AGAR|nr:hypothetical protein BXZ70DRAFT_457401 [Cristinia sonorae]